VIEYTRLPKTVREQLNIVVQKERRRREIEEVPLWKRLLCRIVGHKSGAYEWVGPEHSETVCSRCKRPLWQGVRYVWACVASQAWQVDEQKEREILRTGGP
jgi:hypothetical protein